MQMTPPQEENSFTLENGGTTSLRFVQNMDTTQMPLIVKEDKCDEAKELFQGTGVVITPEGKKHLGAATGTHSFVECYIKQKVSGWVKEIERLSAIANTQPYATYATFTHGLASK